MRPVVHGSMLRLSLQTHSVLHLTHFLSLSDASYSDPLGPQMERPKTAARRKDPNEDEFGDEELGDDLLPE